MDDGVKVDGMDETTVQERPQTRTVADLMSSPVVSTRADDSLGAAARAMVVAGVGSVVVVGDAGPPVGILTERDVVRAAEAHADPEADPVARWMTAAPDLAAPDTPIDEALGRLSDHGYRHLPVVDGDELVGIVSMRDLMRIASLRPAGEVWTGVSTGPGGRGASRDGGPSGPVPTEEAPGADGTVGGLRGAGRGDRAVVPDVPRGLHGVVVTETEVGDVRGQEGFFHYRQHSGVELAEKRSLEDVWALLFDGALPEGGARTAFAAEVAAARALPEGLDAVVRDVAARAPGTGPLDGLRTVLSAVAAAERFGPTYDIDAVALRADGLRLAAVTPTVVAALHRLGQGLEPVAPRADLGHAANYLWMVHGVDPSPEAARAVEQYLVLTVDHGFNASTFTARVIASTGADLGAAVVGALGALSGPLHGGAPSRALDLLDAIGTPDRAEAFIRGAVERGERIMGFGHAVYRTDDPRSVLLRDVAQRLGGDRADMAVAVERLIVASLAELKPGRELYANVEYYAGVVMEAAGLPPSLFTPTFSVSRVIGWCANVLEQATDNRIIRPSARYVGPPPPQPVAAPA